MAGESKKPAIFQGGRDMVISVAVIVIAMIVVVAPTGLWSYSPGEPEFEPVHEVDPQAFIDNEARAADYDIFFPDTPDNWVPNSARRKLIDGESSTVVGWVTAERGFIQIAQTDVPLDQALQAFDSKYRPHEETRQVSGREVTLKFADDDSVSRLWGMEKDGTTVLFDGVASDDEFATIIEATLQAEAYQPA
ncbi:DUF4245 domain-containing protein [Corynebacterium propinquum]|uniref:DUF4245 domain-containing protein n=2 Tax=Corynebacterium propinquum TaxID=43769 RepID=A0ABT7G0N9_9CORY|nr:DUF4245 domain-containing protein [Corynebacterium propinquum]MDK4238881.1 DUF4245 domain-containing protein [Corynebacterium propinquum]MDK4251182.1 DUF4245 domain-containing protein [Corynebacterium propinquum]MDK4300293.1 DUF4245 domain-containing protein [Corynebacterium propinquum]MDK4312952.1 DUF4245 domain-containing protein [Corynebacterium propinquum]